MLGIVVSFMNVLNCQISDIEIVFDVTRVSLLVTAPSCVMASFDGDDCNWSFPSRHRLLHLVVSTHQYTPPPIVGVLKWPIPSTRSLLTCGASGFRRLSHGAICPSTTLPTTLPRLLPLVKRLATWLFTEKFPSRVFPRSDKGWEKKTSSSFPRVASMSPSGMQRCGGYLRQG